MKIKDKRKIDTHGPLDMVDTGECFIFAKDDFDSDVWLKTDDEKENGELLCVNLSGGEAEWMDGDTRVVIVNIHAVILDEKIEK